MHHAARVSAGLHVQGIDPRTVPRTFPRTVTFCDNALPSSECWEENAPCFFNLAVARAHGARYELLYTPHVANLNLWKTSGHFDFYKEGMFDQMDVEGDEYQIKPMNCPFHCLIYKNDLRSYRCVLGSPHCAVVDRVVAPTAIVGMVAVEAAWIARLFVDRGGLCGTQIFWRNLRCIQSGSGLTLSFVLAGVILSWASSTL